MSESEASALLRAGTTYARRVGLRDPSGGLLFAGLKRGAFSLYFDDEPIYHFDLDGRWQRAYVDGNHYRKALNQSVDLIGRARVPVGIALRRRACSRTEIDALDDSVRAKALDILVGLSEGRYAIVWPADQAAALDIEELRDLLDRVATWDATAWFARMEQYVRIYGRRESFVPPDAQNAIVLQPYNNEGWPRDIDEFQTHCLEVAKLLGRRAIQASTAFLDDASSLRRPVAEILANLETIASVFPIRDESRPIMPRDLPPDRPSLSGIDLAFEFWHEGGTLPDLQGWREIVSRRVRRLTVSFRQPGSCRGALQSLVYAKHAGIAISVVLPYGWCDADRLAALVSVVCTLPLGQGDLIHLVETAGDDALPSDEVQRQRQLVKGMLGQMRAWQARVIDYNPAKQWT